MYSTKQVPSPHSATDGDATLPAFAVAITFVGHPSCWTRRRSGAAASRATPTLGSGEYCNLHCPSPFLAYDGPYVFHPPLIIRLC